MGRRSVLLVLVGLLMAALVGAVPAHAAVRPGADVFERGDAGFHGHFLEDGMDKARVPADDMLEQARALRGIRRAEDVR